ncbi:unnamed protein product [Ambrosiozyma monospora]|uniref:Unnamed protein product n=1 Tax=Ambrosiozyma monospora TaxID=43982 RepID=A0ACB5SU86_AMBMO|nr:unnamed protein product [Ambrosiozyma monospora]
MDKDLYEFLEKKGAFEKPPEEQQRHLIQLYLDNLYPIMPVVDRNILDEFEYISPMLLNALMLAGVRYDENLKDREIRITAEKFRKKCKLLEIAENNKITLIQAYLLLSIHEETPEGPMMAREYLCKASTLIVGLGLHNFAANNNHKTTPGLQKSLNSDFKLTYTRSLLSRLFWTSFCCDRMTTVTSAAAMYYHKIDLIVDQPTLDDFDNNERDYEIFKRYHSICELLERIINVVYRIPGYRSIDYSLEKDLLYWRPKNFHSDKRQLIGEPYCAFFEILISFAIILYLRSKVDFMSMLENGADKKEMVLSNSPLTDNKMQILTNASKLIIDSLEVQPVEHVVIIQAVLHVVVLLHLEIKTREKVMVDSTTSQDDPSNLLGFKKELYDTCLKYLKDNSNKWFLSAASYYLCKVLLHKRNSVDDNITFSSEDQTPIDLMAFMSEQPYMDLDSFW